MWPQGHMGPMRLARTGPWVHTNPTGEPTPASHLPHRDGTSASKTKHSRLVLKKEAGYMARQRLLTVEEAETGLGRIIYPIIAILLLMDSGRFLVVRLSYLQLSSGPHLQFKK